MSFSGRKKHGNRHPITDWNFVVTSWIDPGWLRFFRRSFALPAIARREHQPCLGGCSVGVWPGHASARPARHARCKTGERAAVLAFVWSQQVREEPQDSLSRFTWFWIRYQIRVYDTT